MLSKINNFDKIKQRYDALWECEMVDRPPVRITLPNKKQKNLDQRKYKNLKAKWMDIEYRAQNQLLNIENTIYFADAVPIVSPNMGPEIFSAWCGCGYEFGENTTWSMPCIMDWEKDTLKAALDMEHPLFETTEQYTIQSQCHRKERLLVRLFNL